MKKILNLVTFKADNLDAQKRKTPEEFCHTMEKVP
jgi:hypothetical protein